jgi:hypothetical protein
MTEEERATIVAIGDALRANPVSWDAINPEMQAVVMEIMRPRPSFTPEQREFLNHWWLQVDDTKLATINDKLPPNTVVTGRIDKDGNKWICADLFTDSVEPDMRLHAILDDLLGLELHYHEEDFWPVYDEDAT